MQPGRRAMHACVHDDRHTGTFNTSPAARPLTAQQVLRASGPRSSGRRWTAAPSSSSLD